MKCGVNQCVGDTIGPGGIFKALRTGPAWLDIPSRRRAALSAGPGTQLHKPDVDPHPGRASRQQHAHCGVVLQRAKYLKATGLVTR